MKKDVRKDDDSIKNNSFTLTIELISSYIITITLRTISKLEAVSLRNIEPELFKKITPWNDPDGMFVYDSEMNYPYLIHSDLK